MMTHLDPEERKTLEGLNAMLSDPELVPQAIDPAEIDYWKQVAENTYRLNP